MNSGIYTITNLVNHKIYVGLGANAYDRMCNHRMKLRRGAHINIYLQNAWNKYGEENFKFEILEKWSIEHLHSMENWWCNMLNVHNRKYGYNIQPTNPEGRCYSATAETRERMRQSRLKYVKEYGIPPRSAACRERLRISNTGKKASEETLKKMRNRVVSEETRRKNSIAHKGWLPTEAMKKASKRATAVPIIQYSVLGEFIKEWESMSDAAKSIGTNPLNISRCCNPKCVNNKTAKGYIWKYK